MALTSISLTDTSPKGPDKPEFFVMGIEQWFPTICANLNLLPGDVNHPDDEVLIKMILSAVQSRLNPAPQVLKAKCEHMFQQASPDIREAIFVSLLAMALTVIETYNHFQLWSENGNAMYEFDHFVNRDTVVLRQIKTFNYY